jgi:hypothetical protein
MVRRLPMVLGDVRTEPVAVAVVAAPDERLRSASAVRLLRGDSADELTGAAPVRRSHSEMRTPRADACPRRCVLWLWLWVWLVSPLPPLAEAELS